ncbi:MAG TPA: YezD family protein [Pirellulales bacterium]|nr:YezD family protein [Pirellulales bacterium]
MATDSSRKPHLPPRKTDQEELFDHIRQALAHLQFGTVTIVVQNGRVVQIERHEKHRLISNEPGRASLPSQ